MADISAVITTNGDTYNLKDATARESLVPSGGTTGQVLTKTASGYGWEDASGGGGGAWGSITGTLSDQTDLQTALDAKQNKLIAGNNISITDGTSTSTISATKVLVVTVTTASSGYTMNSTYSEIQRAIYTGASFPVLLYNQRYYFLTRIVSGVLYFVNSQIVPNATFRYFTINSSNTVTLYEAAPDGFTSVNKVLSASGWSGDTITVSDDNITATNPIFITYPADTGSTDYEMLKAADIRVTAQSNGSISLQALGTVPTSSLTITLVIWGAL